MTTYASAERIASALGKLKRSGRGFMCLCPAHDDRKPSLYVANGADGRLLLKCHARCEYRDVAAALEARGLLSGANPARDHASRSEPSDGVTVIAPIPKDAPDLDWRSLSRNQPSCFYAYLDANGAKLHLVARWDYADGGKDIRPVVFAERAGARRGWMLHGVPAPRPLYNLHLLARRPDAPVLVVEGEKTADAARKRLRDVVAVTWSGGAQNVGKADWTPLRNRDVTLWPDNDEPGKKAMNELASTLQSLARSVRMVSLPETLPPRWDLADQAPDGVDIERLLAEAAPVQSGLRRHIYTAKELVALPTPPLECLIEPWLPKRGLAMIWAARGLGKTWFALTLALAVARGEKFLEYDVPKPEVVLFVDGEMAMGELQDRIRRLCDPPPDNLHILPSEKLFEAGAPLNINDPVDQQKVIDAVAALEKEGVRPSLIILDNLSSLTAGIDENDNSALDGIMRWMLGLRHSGVTVVFVHHANKSGDQRGASRKEDPLNTSIRLVAPDAKEGGPPQHDGAHFIMEFTKIRGPKPKPLTMELRLVQTPEGRMAWAISTGSRASSRDEVLRYIAEHSPSNQEEIVAAMRRAKGTVSRDCTGLEAAGLIERPPPRATKAGVTRVLDLWPELYSALARQGALPIDESI